MKIYTVIKKQNNGECLEKTYFTLMEALKAVKDKDKWNTIDIINFDGKPILSTFDNGFIDAMRSNSLVYYLLEEI